MNCNCYVKHYLPEIQFGIRYGQHATNCPIFRESLDPVDRANDAEYRADVGAGIMFSQGRYTTSEDGHAGKPWMFNT